MTQCTKREGGIRLTDFRRGREGGLSIRYIGYRLMLGRVKMAERFLRFDPGMPKQNLASNGNNTEKQLSQAISDRDQALARLGETISQRDRALLERDEARALAAQLAADNTILTCELTRLRKSPVLPLQDIRRSGQ